MTVSSTSSRVIYVGNGSATGFAFAFKVNQPADLVVVYTDAAGIDYTLSPSQYAATGFGLDAGGSVTYPLSGGPIASSTRLTIYRDVAATQPTSLSNQGAMWPQVIEAALDRLTFIVQKVTDSVSRSLVISPTDSAALNVLPNVTQRANSVLSFDSQGQPYAGTLTGSLVSVATWITTNFLNTGSPAAARDALGAVGYTTVAGQQSVDLTAGRLQVPSRAAGDNGADAASTAFVKAKAESVVGGVVLRSYLAGLGMANTTTSPNTKIDIAAGVCADSGNVAMLSVSAGTIDCGTVGANGLDAGSLASTTWYHVFAIGTAGGTTALLASTLTSPSMPSGYTLKRRIGSFKTDGSAHIIPFSQNGDEFLWVTPVSVVNDTGVAFPTSLTNLTMVVPTGVVVNAIFSGRFGATAALAIAFSSPVQTGTATAQANVTAHDRGGTIYAAVRTDTAGRIQWLADSAGTSPARIIYTHGWIDRRGRDN
jgi:hypothetical protein